MIGEGLGLILGLLTLVSVVASAVAVARATLAKTTIETLKENNDALSARVGLLEQENGRQAAQVVSLLAENASLQSYVSGADAVKELAKVIGDSERTRAAEHVEVMAALRGAQ